MANIIISNTSDREFAEETERLIDTINLLEVEARLFQRRSNSFQSLMNKKITERNRARVLLKRSLTRHSSAWGGQLEAQVTKAAVTKDGNGVITNILTNSDV